MDSIHSEPGIDPGRITHKKCWLLAANPEATSIISLISIKAMLPMLMYITEFTFCLFNHSMQLLFSSSRLVGAEATM
ncbi:hypothetical protein AXX17_AT3G40500 [Arabidopsis thaliana]|uniref:Uncharacterized protein n=1 Tax=Arabidopsis thaliana TaxID=3702 RepID=A0A178V9L4_ARATH|nr:hypothetical protein AXX17_AT3G40500 [Arabidopsis thaliana]